MAQRTLIPISDDARSESLPPNKGKADKSAMIAAARACGFSPAADNEAGSISTPLWAIRTNGGLS